MAAFLTRASLLGVMLLAGASPLPSPSPTSKSAQPCVFANPYSFPNPQPCASFTTVGARILSIIPSSAFGKGLQPEEIVALDDGSVMVRTNRSGLFRVVKGRIIRLWRPNPRCGPRVHLAFSLAASFDDQAILQSSGYQIAPVQPPREPLMSLPSQIRPALSGEVASGTHPGVVYSPDQIEGVRTDGSMSFKWPSEFREVAQDAGGVVWFLEKDYATIYAYFPRTRSRVRLAPSTAIFSIFRSPNGKVYAGTFDGLFELDARPNVGARLVPERRQPGVSPVQAVGRDGSLWASTATDVLHIHPDGSMRVLQLIRPPTEMSVPWPLLQVKMAPDGSVWLTDGKLVRITRDDRVAVVTVPRDNDWSGPTTFGPDSSLWTVVHDPQTHATLGIVNFMPSDSSRGVATASPFGKNAVASPVDDYGSCPPPTPPPTPSPPLPPRSGAVYFVYAANGDPSSVAAYWAGRDGRLVSIRGSPFRAASGLESVTIDPAGRFLYAGGWYGGIAVYAIDAQTGTLHEIAGSPFGNLRGPSWVVIDPSDRDAYVADINSKNIAVFSIDARGGALTPVAGSPFAVESTPYRLALNPVRDFAYVVFSAPIETFATAGRTFKRIGEAHPKTPSHGFDTLVDPSGARAYITNDSANTISTYTIDARTGILNPIPRSTLSAGIMPRDIRMGPSGHFLYVADLNSRISVYRVNEVTGALRSISGSPFRGGLNGPQAMTITPDGALLYATNFDSSSVAGFAIDTRTGALTPLTGSPFKAGDHPWGIASCRRIGNRCRP